MTAGSSTGAPDTEQRLAAVGQTLTGEPQPGLSFLLGKVRRHVEWARTEGVRRLIEEDQLDPVDRASTWWRKSSWQRQHGARPGTARAVFVVGLQRSGTNMVLRAVEASPETVVYNENSGRAFQRFRLIDSQVPALVGPSRARAVLFKPLCDSHRLDELLAMPLTGGSRAVWIYRDVDGRVRSTLSKFGDHDRAVLTAIAAGRGDGLWQAGGLSADTLATIRNLDPAGLSPESASALFWWARNRLVLERGWAQREDVLLVSYQRVLADAATEIRRLCEFVGVTFSAEMAADIAPSRPSGARLELDPEVRRLCTELATELDRHLSGEAGR